MESQTDASGGDACIELIPLDCEIGVIERLSKAAFERESGRLWPLLVMPDRYVAQFGATTVFLAYSVCKRATLASSDLTWSRSLASRS
jgi:hypothetical protein